MTENHLKRQPAHDLLRSIIIASTGELLPTANLMSPPYVLVAGSNYMRSLAILNFHHSDSFKYCHKPL